MVNFKIKRIFDSSETKFPDLKLSRKSKKFLELKE